MQRNAPIAHLKEASRDDFSESTKRKLKDRVGGRCSNPACRVPTLGPTTDEDRVSNIGVAAHITAAAPGGPRYDRSLSPQQRSAFKNGIWLCSNHASMIDRDEVVFTESLIRTWKVAAELAARSEQGRRLPSDEDAINTISAAFTGTGRNFIPSAVKNVHAAMSETLQRLDPRFRVESSHVNGITQFSITPEEPVELSVAFDVLKVPDVPSKVSKLLSFGQDFEIEGSSVTIRGSPLWDHISAEASAGRFGVMAHRRPVKQKMWVQYEGQTERHYLDDMDGYMSAGSESVHFEANGWGGLLAVSMDAPRSVSHMDTTVNLTLEFQSWQSVDVRRLPYFNALARLLEHLSAGAHLYLAIETDGNPILTSSRIQLPDQDWITNTRVLLDYSGLARSLASVLDICVRFDIESDISKESYRLLAEMNRVATGKLRIAKSQINSNPKITITANDNGASLFAEANSQHVIRIQNQFTEPIEIFGQTIALPNRATTMHPVRIKLADSIKKIAAGMSVVVELEMLENFELSIEFEKTH